MEKRLQKIYQIPIFELVLGAGVSFDGAFSLWVSLKVIKAV